MVMRPFRERRPSRQRGFDSHPPPHIKYSMIHARGNRYTMCVICEICQYLVNALRISCSVVGGPRLSFWLNIPGQVNS